MYVCVCLGVVLGGGWNYVCCCVRLFVREQPELFCVGGRLLLCLYVWVAVGMVGVRLFTL